MGRAMGLAGGIAVMGGGRSDSRSVWTRSVKASGESGCSVTVALISLLSYKTESC